MKTLKLLIVALAMTAFGFESQAQLTLNWHGNIYPYSHTINFNYWFSSGDTIRLDFMSTNLTLPDHPTSVVSVYDVTNNGTMQFDISNLIDTVQWVFRVEAKNQANNTIAAFPINVNPFNPIQTLGLEFEVSDAWFVEGDSVVFTVNASYGDWPNDVPILYFYMKDVVTGEIDTMSTPVVSWSTDVYHFSYLPQIGHFYTYCAEILYSDYTYLDHLALWSDVSIANSCNEPIPYPYAMTTGLQEQPSNIEWLKVYPNPASDVITIEGLNKNLPIEIRDLTGRLVSTKLLTSSSMNISELLPGIYFLKQSDGRSIRFVKH